MVSECCVTLVEQNQEKCGISGLIGLTRKRFRYLLSALAQDQRLCYMFWHFLKLPVLSGLLYKLRRTWLWDFLSDGLLQGWWIGKAKVWSKMVLVLDPSLSLANLLVLGKPPNPWSISLSVNWIGGCLPCLIHRVEDQSRLCILMDKKWALSCEKLPNNISNCFPTLVKENLSSP